MPLLIKVLRACATDKGLAWLGKINNEPSTMSNRAKATFVCAFHLGIPVQAHIHV